MAISARTSSQQELRPVPAAIVDPRRLLALATRQIALDALEIDALNEPRRVLEGLSVVEEPE